MRKYVLIFSIVLMITACTPTGHDSNDHRNANDHGNIHQEENAKGGATEVSSDVVATKNTTRLISESEIDLAIQVSKMIWPATTNNNRPNAVILVNDGDWATALAATSLIHHPTDGPILFATSEGLSKQTLQEIERLNPKGIQQAEGTQIIIVGNMSETVLNQLGDYKISRIQTESPENAALLVDQYYADLTGDLPNSVIIGSLDSPAMTIPSGNWIAHMAEPLLYVKNNEIPEETRRALEKRNGNAKMYLMGTGATIIKEVEEELSQYGEVVRIEGTTAEEISIQFAKFKDQSNGFGWGINEPGHGLLFVSQGQIEMMIPAVAFAHRGKHAPMLVLGDDNVSEVMMTYLYALKPYFEVDPTEGPYNHAFIVGSLDSISYQIQGQIDDILEIESASGMDHEGH